MADDNSSEKTKQINTSKIEELEVTGHESSPVKENDPKRDLQAEKSAWGEEEQAKLDSLIDNIESRRSKLLELNRNIQELSGKKIDRMGAVSYSEAQIKESIDSLIKNLEGIKKVNSLEVKGKGDFMEIKADINAEKETFLKTIKVSGIITIIFGNEEGKIVVKNHHVKGRAFGDETLINGKLKPVLPKVPEFLKDYIENKEGNYTKRIFIEGGELKAEFDTPETEAGVTEKLEKLELEKKTEESLLVELERTLQELQGQKNTILEEENSLSKNEEKYEPFNIRKSMEVPVVSKIEKRIHSCASSEDLQDLIKEINNNQTVLTVEEINSWRDVEPILESDKKEMLDIINLWKEWAGNDENPKLQKWSKECITVLGKKMSLEADEPEKDGEEPQESPEEKVEETNETTSGNKEEEKSAPEQEVVSTEEPSVERQEPTSTEGVEYIPIIEEANDTRKVILEEGYLKNEITNELKSFLDSKDIVAVDKDLIKIESSDESIELEINISEKNHHRGAKKWHLKATLNKEENSDQIKFNKFEYEKDDSHFFRLDLQNKLNDILEKVYEKISKNHGENTNPKNTKLVIKNGKLEIIFDKNDKN